MNYSQIFCVYLISKEKEVNSKFRSSQPYRNCDAGKYQYKILTLVTIELPSQYYIIFFADL